MIGQFIALYRARNDAALAKHIASEMIVDGVIDRAGWPLTIVKFWMAVGIVIATILIIVLLLVGSFTHWTLAIPTLPLCALIYAIARIWRGINAGVERVTEFAKIELGHKAANLQMPSFKKN